MSAAPSAMPDCSLEPFGCRFIGREHVHELNNGYAFPVPSPWGVVSRHHDRRIHDHGRLVNRFL